MPYPERPQWSTILHISDLHCGGPTQEQRRCLEGGPSLTSYVNAMADAVLRLDREEYKTVDMIVATGDFVHQHQKDAFPFAGRVLDAIANKFGVPRERVVTCPGNHDFDRERQKKGLYQAARAHYLAFASEFGSPLEAGDLPEGCCRIFEIGGPGPLTTVLSLDTTWGDRSARPGNLSDSDDDEGALRVGNFVIGLPPDRTVVLLSHFPIRPDGWAGSHLQGEEGYVEKHFATRLLGLFNHLNGLKREGHLAWFFGDVHRAFTPRPSRLGRGDHAGWSFEFTSGRLDSPEDKAARLAIPRGFRIVRLGHGQPFAESLYFEYHNLNTYGHSNFAYRFRDPVLHHLDPQSGEWLEGGEGPGPARSAKRRRRTNRPATPSPTPTIATPREPSEEGGTSKGSPVSDGLAYDLRRKLAEEGLVDLRRVKASDSYDRLTHIKLGPIVNDHEIMVRAFRLFANQIKVSILEQHPTRSGKDLGLIGLDCWGAWMAAEVGFRLGMPSLGVSVRGLDDENLVFDLRHSLVGESVLNWKAANLVILTDVIVTGHTACRVRDHLRQLLEWHAEGHSSMPDFWVMSLIEAKDNAARSPEFRERGGGGFAGIYSLLRDVPFPVIQRDEIPRDLLPSSDFLFA